ncbi:unnamed protein product, partial [Prorocentrum cordatum]
MAPSPWHTEAKADWMCKFCTFRRTGGLPLINYGSNEKYFKCKLHKGVCFKQVVPEDAPSRSTKRKPALEPSAAWQSSRSVCSRSKQRASACGRFRTEGRLRMRLMELMSYLKKSTRLQKAEQDKIAADKALAAAQLAATSAANVVEERKKAVEDLEEEVRALSSQPAPQPMAVDLTGPEFHICEEKLLACLGSMEGVADASKLAPKLVEALKSRAAEFLEEPPEKKTKRETSQPPSQEQGTRTPQPSEWKFAELDVEQLRQDVGDFVAENAEEATLREKAMQLAA